MKRRIVLAAIFLLAGAVVNVVIAWVFAQPAPELPVATIYFPWQGTSQPDTAWWKANAPQSVSVPPIYETFPSVGFGRKSQYMQAHRSRGQFNWPGPHTAHVVRIWSGWPTYSLHYAVWEVKGQRFVEDAWVLRLASDSTYVLPFAPYFPEFVINTIFYAVVLWLLIPGPFALRRFIRMKRGRCVKCGYPMGQSAVCSECGRELPRRIIV